MPTMAYPKTWIIKAWEKGWRSRQDRQAKPKILFLLVIMSAFPELRTGLGILVRFMSLETADCCNR